MRDGIMLTVAEDGTARVYDDTYDIVIHCESQEEHDKAMAMLRGMNPNNDNRPADNSIDTNSSRYGTNDSISRQAVNAANIISLLSEIRSQYNCFNSDDERYYRALSEAIKVLTAQPEQQMLSDWKEDFKGYINAIAIDLSRDDYYGIMEYIDEVPSAQTELKPRKGRRA